MFLLEAIMQNRKKRVVNTRKLTHNIYSIHMRKRLDSERGWKLEPIWYDSYGKFGNLRRVITKMSKDPESSGESSWGTRNLLYALTVSLRPQNVLEIGAHIGSASIAIATGLQKNNYGKLISLEPAEHYFNIASNYISMAKLSTFVEFKKLFSTDASLEKKYLNKFQLIFLDANHSYSHAYRDLELAWLWLEENGILVIDDVGKEMANKQCEENRGGVRQALLDFAQVTQGVSPLILEHPVWLNPCGIAIVAKKL
jgi:predicted O-methyltransferase YrrM